MDADPAITLTSMRIDATEMAQSAEDLDPKPVYDAMLRELRVGGVVTKVYRQPARNQEALLRAFQRAGWKRRIKSPKELSTDRRRLRETLDQHTSEKPAQVAPLPWGWHRIWCDLGVG